MATIKAHIIPATNTLSAWEAANPVILDGELVVVEAEDGVKRFKIGNGINTFNQLPFWHPEIDIDPDTKNWRIGGEDTGVTARATLDLRKLTDGEREQMRGYPGPSVYELALRNNKTTAETEALWLDELGAPELERQENEAERIYEENRRNSNESDREAKELKRISDEAIRQRKDEERAAVYTQREKDEVARRSAEEVRDNKEIIREQQEQDRVGAENIRGSKFAGWDLAMQGVIPNASDLSAGAVKAKSKPDETAPYTVPTMGTIEDRFTATNGAVAGKQDALIAGDNVTIIDNTISAKDTIYTAGDNINIVDGVISGTAKYDDTQIKAGIETKQDKLTAGDNINIDPVTNTISGTAQYDDTQIKADVAKKQDKLIAGANVQIDDATNTISAVDTITTINGMTGAITKADITALGIPSQDTVYQKPTSEPISYIQGLQADLDSKVESYGTNSVMQIAVINAGGSTTGIPNNSLILELE